MIIQNLKHQPIAHTLNYNQHHHTQNQHIYNKTTLPITIACLPLHQAHQFIHRNQAVSYSIQNRQIWLQLLIIQITIIITKVLMRVCIVINIWIVLQMVVMGLRWVAHLRKMILRGGFRRWKIRLLALWLVIIIMEVVIAVLVWIK